MGKTKNKEPDFSFVDKTIRFSVDELLRNCGFQILYRANGKEPVWKKEGQEYSQTKALASLNNDKVEDARYLQDLYYEGYC